MNLHYTSKVELYNLLKAKIGDRDAVILT